MIRVMAGCAGFFLLLPGLCFVFVGLSALHERFSAATIEIWLAAVFFFFVAGYLIYLAFRAPDIMDREPPT